MLVFEKLVRLVLVFSLGSMPICKSALIGEQNVIVEKKIRVFSTISALYKLMKKAVKLKKSKSRTKTRELLKEYKCFYEKSTGRKCSGEKMLKDVKKIIYLYKPGADLSSLDKYFLELDGVKFKGVTNQDEPPFKLVFGAILAACSSLVFAIAYVIPPPYNAVPIAIGGFMVTYGANSALEGVEEQEKINRNSRSKNLEYEFELPEFSDEEDYVITPEITNQSITEGEIDQFLDRMNFTGKALEFIMKLENSNGDVDILYNEWSDSVKNCFENSAQ